MASSPREMILTLYSALQATSGVLCSVLVSTVQERQIATGEGPAEARKLMRGLEHLSSEKRLQELSLFSLEKIERGPHQNTKIFLN